MIKIQQQPKFDFMRSESQDCSKLLNNPMLNYHIVPRSDLTEGENMRYFEEYKKLYYTAYCMQSQMKQFQKTKLDLQTKIDEVNKNIQNCQKSERGMKNIKNHQQKPKRFRRTNEMIERTFRCTYSKCDKAYASEGSLQQHIRLKHQDSPPQYNPSRHPRRERRSKVEDQSVSEDGYSQSEQSQVQASEEAVVKKQEDI